MDGELAIQAFGTVTGTGCLVRAVYEAVRAVRPRPGRARPMGTAFVWFLSCTLAFGIAAAVGLSR
ncbi:hypothetical protein AB0M11_02380 [Streptomyces sp. NPDC051987]|uniref:hypothetical protein n=1 Tax=Streptomyces sp. NPDC051987 TaxID=3155808 RepID=UPI0034189CB0